MSTERCERCAHVLSCECGRRHLQISVDYEVSFTGDAETCPDCNGTGQQTQKKETE